MNDRVDVAMSEAVIERMDSRPKAGDCWGNAFRAIPAVAELLGSAPAYVEGLAGLPHVQMVPHGWLLTADGRVVDVSPGWGAKASLVKYTEHRRFTVREVLDHLDRGTLPVIPYEELRKASSRA